MIAWLRGKVIAIEESAVVLDVGGIGYRVHVPSSLALTLGPEGAEIVLHTHMHVRETELELFGAADPGTLTLFRQLLTVNGIGPKVALATLSTLDADQLRQAVLREDVARITEVPGIGKKTAQRVILDLKSRLEAEGLALDASGAALPAVSSTQDEEAIEALLSLGYTRGEARRALAGIDPGLDVEARILAALRSLSS